MSESGQNTCKDPSGHHLHICELNRTGAHKEVIARTDNPAYLCHNCNASANQAEDLCNPSPFLR